MSKKLPRITAEEAIKVLKRYGSKGFVERMSNEFNVNFFQGKGRPGKEKNIVEPFFLCYI
jgi:hypothetical protein